MLKYIAEILPNGEIQALRLPKGANNTPEGYSGTGIFVVYIGFEIDNKPLFMQTHYYDFTTNSFHEREMPPNPIAYWENGAWTWDVNKFLDLVRQERDIRLGESDWTQVADVPLTFQQVAESRQYRQELRDIVSVCAEFTRLEDIPWPTKPDYIK